MCVCMYLHGRVCGSLYARVGLYICICVYAHVCMHVCVCVCVCVCLPNLLHRQDVTQGQFLIGLLQVLILSFPSLRLVA